MFLLPNQFGFSLDEDFCIARNSYKRALLSVFSYLQF